jgi:hypothetical protein
VAITDGDEDGISKESLRTSGSVQLRLVPGTDDVVGAEVRAAIFSGGSFLPGRISAEEMASRIAELAGARLIEMRTAP